VLQSLVQSACVCGCTYSPFVDVTVVLVWRVICDIIVRLLVIIKYKNINKSITLYVIKFSYCVSKGHFIHYNNMWYRENNYEAVIV